MQFDRENNAIKISVDKLASYAFPTTDRSSQTAKFGFHKSVSNDTEKSISEKVYLDLLCGRSNYTLIISGYADSITYDGILYSIEALHTSTYLPSDLTPFHYPEFFAKTCVLAYLYVTKEQLSDIKIKLSFKRSGDDFKTTFTAKFSEKQLARMVESLISRISVLLDAFYISHTKLRDELNVMPFPYHSIRDGQEEFIKSAYRTLRHGDTLVASAPTGIGKTMSALFPSLKAVGSRYIDKIFYFTAKTVTGIAALEASEKISKYTPSLRTIMISSKEQFCAEKSGAVLFERNCKYCKRNDSLPSEFSPSFLSARERLLGALVELLNSENHIYDTKRIIKTAEKYTVCPYELSLDLSEYCQVIVCDYNYIIDERIRFKRYFKNPECQNKFAFLFDESHNLPDRVRSTYSSELSLSHVRELKNTMDSTDIFAEQIKKLVNELLDLMKSVRDGCSEGERIVTDQNGEHTVSYHESQLLPDEVIIKINTLTRLFSKLSFSNAEAAHLLAPFYQNFSSFSTSSAFFDEKFRFLATRYDSDVTLKIICIDPSGIIDNLLHLSNGTILFSATLSPIDYFKDVTGQTDAETLDLPSPYDQNNLCVIAYDSISTRLNDRTDSISDCAEVISEIVSAREGKYIVYFTSYDYMKKVCLSFSKINGDMNIVMQKPSMSYREKERFIQIFEGESYESVVGFCVLGGVFSEGIDLAGDSLIGSIIVGIGMPQLSAERNITANYYNEKMQQGYEFAYVYPGMVKVMQAAGRVIRSENDKGVIVILDDRLKDPRMIPLLPPHWNHIKFTGNTYSLGVILEDFWNRFPSV